MKITSQYTSYAVKDLAVKDYKGLQSKDGLSC